MTTEPDLRGLEALALQHGGYFDRGDAQAHALSDQLLRHHRQAGRFEGVYPGVYRLAVAPPAPDDELLLEALARRPNYHGRRVARPAIEAARATS